MAKRVKKAKKSAAKKVIKKAPAKKVVSKARSAAAAGELRSPQEVARRCVVLIAVVATGHGDRRPKLLPWLKNEGLLGDVSPDEMRVLKAKALAHRDQANSTWRVEAIVPLLWALGKLPKLPVPTMKSFSIRGCMPLPLEPAAEFIATAKLRPDRALRDAQDLVYNQNWACRDARLNGRKPQRAMDPEVIQERHYALNWLVNDEGEAWDEVSTDT